MAIVDAQGRLFGRLNLLDAFLALFLLALIPLGYGAYVLFRTPLPRLTAVDPVALPMSTNLRVTVRGEHLRPYMRVSFGDHQGRTFLFKSATEAEVDINDIRPGVYDVVLYDFAQERSRLTQALTIAPSAVPPRRMVVVGMLANLTGDQAKQITVGMPLADFGNVLQVGKPVPEVTRVNAGRVIIEVPLEQAVRVPITLDMRCDVRTPEGRPDCITAGVVLQPDALMALPTPVGLRPFQIDQVRGPQPIEMMTIRVRFSADAGALGLVAAGDVDIAASMNELASGARVVTPRPAQGTSREADLLVPVQNTTAGRTYLGMPLRIGGAFVLRTAQYEVTGTVLDMTPR
jgi:hypothetical protein